MTSKPPNVGFRQNLECSRVVRYQIVRILTTNLILVGNSKVLSALIQSRSIHCDQLIHIG